jgi:hypothetical protein
LDVLPHGLFLADDDVDDANDGDDNGDGTTNLAASLETIVVMPGTSALDTGGGDDADDEPTSEPTSEPDATLVGGPSPSWVGPCSSSLSSSTNSMLLFTMSTVPPVRPWLVLSSLEADAVDEQTEDAADVRLREDRVLRADIPCLVGLLPEEELEDGMGGLSNDDLLPLREDEEDEVVVVVVEGGACLSDLLLLRLPLLFLREVPVVVVLLLRSVLTSPRWP